MLAPFGVIAASGYIWYKYNRKAVGEEFNPQNAQ
jgi:hypothetical protein